MLIWWSGEVNSLTRAGSCAPTGFPPLRDAFAPTLARLAGAPAPRKSLADNKKALESALDHYREAHATVNAMWAS